MSPFMKSKNWLRNWLVVLSLAIGASARANVPAADYVAGEALVRFQPAETLTSAQQIAARHGLTLARHFAWLSDHEGQVIGLLHSPTLTTGALLAELQAEPAIAFAEPNFLRYPADLRPPNDPKFNLLYGLRNTGQAVNGLNGTPNDDISFLKAWGLARPSTNEIVVAVIDSGLDPTHPDLSNNLWRNPAEIAGNTLDDDANGYVDDVHGFDFVYQVGRLVDTNEHGTHVSGIIAATGNNGLGVIGVDFQAHIMMLKVLDPNGSNFVSSAVVEATQYAAMMKSRGVNVVAINASYGGGGYSSTEATAIQAAGSVGIIFCAAAGNNASDNGVSPFYPASYRLPNMIVVAASDQWDGLAGFSNYGATSVDLAAPGSNILSCLPTTSPSYDTHVQQGPNLFPANTLTYTGATSGAGVTGAIYYCDLGNPADFPAAVSNNIALIRRGTLFFSDKVTNAKAAGAKAAIIFNNVPGNFNGTLGAPGSWLPAVSLSQADGQLLQAALPSSGAVVNALDPTQVYQIFSGTSMAAPQVSGAIAFAARNFPTEAVTPRIQRILTNATPVPAFAGKTITRARLNLARIVDTDNNGLPDWWEFQYFNLLTGTDPGADPDHDGASNLAEFLAGTVPTDPQSWLRLTAQSPAGGSQITLTWPAAAGRYYRLLRGPNLLTGFSTIVQTNLSATPPLNTLTDTLPVGTKNTFYRLQLEP